MILTAVFVAFILYFLYTRFYIPWSTIFYYKRQGVPFHRGAFTPLVGSYPSIIAYDKAHSTDLTASPHPILGWIMETYSKNGTHRSDESAIPPVTSACFGQEVALFFNSPEALEEILVTQNKYFDKEPSTGDSMKTAVGDSIVFARSTLKWQHKRKVLSAAMYKEKLRQML